MTAGPLGGTAEGGAGAPKAIDRPHLLLVEGEDERRLFGVLLGKLGRDDVQVESYGGRDRAPKVLEYISRRTGFEKTEAIGVLRDAEEDAAAAFQSVRDALKRGSLRAPVQPGTFSDGTAPRRHLDSAAGQGARNA